MSFGRKGILIMLPMSSMSSQYTVYNKLPGDKV